MSAVSNEGVEVKWKGCPICSGKLDEKFFINDVGTKKMIACKCGIMSKTFDNIIELRFWWHTRRGKEPNREAISVTHTRRTDGQPVGAPTENRETPFG